MTATISRLAAFARRDFLTALSYKAAFISDMVGLAFQIVMFYFVSLLVDPTTLPTYGDQQSTYLEFASVGIVLSAFMGLALSKTSTALRNEQLTGTLESMLMTPVKTWVIQLGLAAYELVYVPLRTAVFLGVLSIVLGVTFSWSGALGALLVLVVFIPFMWGVGMIGAGVILTFKRGGGMVGLFSTALSLMSGAYFPVTLLPGWAEGFAASNPVGRAFEASRDTLLGGASVSDVSGDVFIIAIWAAVALVLGHITGNLALARERRRGTLSTY